MQKHRTKHQDFLQHEFTKLVDVLDRGDEIHKVYQCQCGARMVEVFSHISEVYEDL